MQKSEAQRGCDFSKFTQQISQKLEREPRIPCCQFRALSAPDVFRAEMGTIMAQRGALGGQGSECAIGWWLQVALAAAASGTGVSEKVVVAPILDLARGLAPCLAFGVQELTALDLLPPEPASKHSTDMVGSVVPGWSWAQVTLLGRQSLRHQTCPAWGSETKVQSAML
jgi:hypothetical protein